KGLGGALREMVDKLPSLVDVVKSGKLEAFVKSDQGKVVIANVIGAVHALRRGQPIDVVDKLVKRAEDAAKEAAAPPGPPASIEERLKKLDELRDKKLLGPEEYQRERERILKGL